MKKKVIGIMVVAMMVMATGCGNSNAGSVSTSDASGAETGAQSSTSIDSESYEVVLLPSATGNTWWDLSGEALENWAAETGNKGFYVGSTNYDAAEQLSILQDEIAQKPDAILLQPVSADSVNDACKDAMNQGIVVIGVEAADVENLDYDVIDHTNDTYCPHLIELLVEHMGEEGEWVFMTPSLENATWVSYGNDSRTYAEETYPNLTAVEEIVGAGGADYDSAYNKAKELLMKYPNLKGIISQGQSAAVGAAVADMGLSEKVTVIGSGCMPSENGEAIANGSVDVICTSNPILLTEAMANLAVKVCAGENIGDTMDLGVEGYTECKVEGKIVSGSQFTDVDADNIDEWKDIL